MGLNSARWEEGFRAWGAVTWPPSSTTQGNTDPPFSGVLWPMRSRPQGDVDPRAPWALCCRLKGKAAFLRLPGSCARWPPCHIPASPVPGLRMWGSVLPTHSLNNSFRVGPHPCAGPLTATRRQRPGVVALESVLLLLEFLL